MDQYQQAEALAAAINRTVDVNGARITLDGKVTLEEFTLAVGAMSENEMAYFKERIPASDSQSANELRNDFFLRDAVFLADDFSKTSPKWNYEANVTLEAAINIIAQKLHGNNRAR